MAVKRWSKVHTVKLFLKHSVPCTKLKLKVSYNGLADGSILNEKLKIPWNEPYKNNQLVFFEEDSQNEQKKDL